ncbi:hypothetical protein H4W80_007348 [Nonomuraea angiospora]|uniref:Uncharacterized protein n=1 Tax=Nonomuraea angiospora TaxID=46172 RepID=A0ABR9M929_9ACTN|nr:hypothetical protein [Nonomuraea angiospora]
MPPHGALEAAQGRAPRRALRERGQERFPRRALQARHAGAPRAGRSGSGTGAPALGARGAAQGHACAGALRTAQGRSHAGRSGTPAPGAPGVAQGHACAGAPRGGLGNACAGVPDGHPHDPRRRHNRARPPAAARERRAPSHAVSPTRRGEGRAWRPEGAWRDRPAVVQALGPPGRPAVVLAPETSCSAHPPCSAAPGGPERHAVVPTSAFWGGDGGPGRASAWSSSSQGARAGTRGHGVEAIGFRS